jgi:hypothetical protein
LAIVAPLPPARRTDPTAAPRRPRAQGAVAGLAAALALAVGVSGWLSLAPDLADRLRDDAFYEFAWAANLAAGRGPVVSDGVATSGVQWLWCLLLAPIAWAFGPAALPTAAPWFGLLLHAATACGWALTIRRRWLGVALAACWFGHPLLLRESQNGQETALACLLASALWWGRRAANGRFAALATLATLARTDLLFVVAALAVWRQRRFGGTALLAPVVAGAALALCNRAIGGGWLQDSALPMAWLWHANWDLAHPDGAGFWRQQWWYLRPVLLGAPFAAASTCGFGLVVWLALRRLAPARWRFAPLAAVVAAWAGGLRDVGIPLLGAACLAAWPGSSPPRRRRLPAVLWLAFGLAAIVALHWAVRWYPRAYYAAPLAVAAFAALPAFAARSPWLLAAFAAGNAFDGTRLVDENLRAQVEMELAGSQLAAVLPADERVGCFNSGIVTFHADVLARAAGAPRRGVVNLDGVVDARSFAALQRRGLGAWLDAEGVRFVLDNPVQFALDPTLPHACGPWFGGGFDPARDLVEIARFDDPAVDNGRPGGESMRLYWRRGRGTMPQRPTAAVDLGVARDGARCALVPLAAGDALWRRTADGAEALVLTAEAATAAVVRLPAAGPAAQELFVRGEAAPRLRLPPL